MPQNALSRAMSKASTVIINIDPGWLWPEGTSSLFMAKKMGRFMLPRYRAAAPIARTKSRVFYETALFSCRQLKRAKTS